jgi:hypothetical protein
MKLMKFLVIGFLAASLGAQDFPCGSVRVSPFGAYCF